ncbi:MAG: SDR family oxidoreductase, partial [Desulfobacterales bacterium]|nr:SDR family oxidoreductase [Desulfobacterales bacterium]
MQSLKGKHVLITGAGCGIGKLMAREAAAEQAKVILIDINEENLKAAQTALEMLPGESVAYTCDISDRERVASVSEKIKAQFGHVDVLINNAGIVIGKAFTDLTIEEMQRTMDVNYWGHVYFTHQFLPGMVARGRGNIVNIASSSGMLGMVNLSDYCASKFADVGFSEALRRELKSRGHSGIVVTCVCPYVIATGMFKGFNPLLFNPVLKPEQVAGAVMMAIRKNKPYVIQPFFMILMTRLLKVILPTGLFDWILHVTGGSRAM